ncbi:MAG: outer membrane lipoprotein carrier protein LolA [candidate division Zixibacteria bacterium]|nr:outer membrane lipoprotein carrier protein LolA [candidate division Zixibacteria bacterium]
MIRIKMKKLGFSLSLLVALLFSSVAFPITPVENPALRSEPSGSKTKGGEELALQVETKYKSLLDLSLDFTKVTKSEIFENQKKIKGKMYLKNPDKFRTETEDEVIVTDGKFLWNYSEENQQVIKNRLDRSKNIFKLNQYLSNFRSEYKTELIGEEKVDKVKCYKLKLIPKKDDLFITKMTIWVDKKSLLAKKLEYQDSNDTEIILIFDHIKINQGISDSKFVFKAPPGVEELDLSE